MKYILVPTCVQSLGNVQEERILYYIHFFYLCVINCLRIQFVCPPSFKQACVTVSVGLKIQLYGPWIYLQYIYIFCTTCTLKTTQPNLFRLPQTAASLTPPSDDNCPAAPVPSTVFSSQHAYVQVHLPILPLISTKSQDLSLYIFKHCDQSYFVCSHRCQSASHVMGTRCQGGLSSREQNQRPSAQSGIVVLTINMRAMT